LTRAVGWRYLTKMQRTVIMLAVVIQLASLPVGAQDADRIESLRFAEHLFEERDFYRAITEYKRYLFAQPDSSRAPWVRFRIAEAYLEGGKLDAAGNIFAELARKTPGTRLGNWAILARARAFYLQGRLMQAWGVLDDISLAGTSDEMRGVKFYLKGCVQLKAESPAKAQRSFLSIAAVHPLAERASLLAARAQEALDLPLKSPVLAGLLSIVPGLGHVYLGEYSVALTAFMWNGLFGYAAYDAISRGYYGLGALAATLELLWYSGTIYGAVSGAERYNRDARMNFLDDLDNAAGLDVAFPDPHAVGAILLQGKF